VATHDHPLNIRLRNAHGQGKVRLETRRVQRPAHPDNAVFGQTQRLERQVRHGVHGVGNDDDNGLGRVFEKLRGDALDDSRVDADEFFAGHAGFARQPRRNDDDLGTGRFGVVVGRAGNFGVKIEQRCRLGNVESFAFRQAFLDVKQDDFGT
jgi:hypothetical protein